MEFQEVGLAPRPSSVFKASCFSAFLRVTGAPLGWMAGVGWMANQAHLDLLGSQ